MQKYFHIKFDNPIIFWMACCLHLVIAFGLIIYPEIQGVTPLRIFLYIPNFLFVMILIGISIGVIWAMMQEKLTYFHFLFLVLQQCLLFLSLFSIYLSVEHGTGSFGDPRPRSGVLFTNMTTSIFVVFHTIVLIRNIILWKRTLMFNYLRGL